MTARAGCSVRRAGTTEVRRRRNLALVRSFWQPVFRTTLLTDGDPSAQGARRRSAASRPPDHAEAEGYRSRMQSTQVADDALKPQRHLIGNSSLCCLHPARAQAACRRRSSTQQTTGLHRTMAKVCKSDGEGTFAGTRGNGEVAPILDIRTIETKPLITARRAASLLL
jgi:hypothetical protein